MEIDRRIRELLLDLCSIPSVSQSDHEDEMARRIHTILAAMPAFADAPENLSLVDCGGRLAVMALLRVSDPTTLTVGLTGHFDVVSTAIYGDLAPLAFDPERLAAAMSDRNLTPAVRRDLEAGWLFGRGTADMKCGLAVHMALMERWGTNPPCNILFVAVPDEENLSLGMRGVLSEAARWIESRGLSVVAWVNGEPNVAARSREWPVHRGSIGKTMGFVLSVGVGCHVGEFFKGISAVQIAGQVNAAIEGHPDSADQIGDRFLPPAACLGLEPLRGGYSVTLYDRVMARYNLLYWNRTPAKLLDILRAGAQEGLNRALEMTERSARAVGASVQLNTPKVLSLSELRDMVPDGSVGADCSARSCSVVDRACSLVLNLLDRSALEGPLAVVGFLPPWYPPRRRDDDQAEDFLDQALDAVFVRARELGVDPLREPIFEGISDLSYLGRSDEVTALTENMAGWGELYSVPLEAMAAVHAPVCNLGPFGMDIHKATERLEPRFAFSVLPELVEELVRALAGR